MKLFKVTLLLLGLSNGLALASESPDPSLVQVLKIGTQLREWVRVENTRRDSMHRLRLSGVVLRAPYTIENPKVYSPSLIVQSFQRHWNELPAPVQKVLLGIDPAPSLLSSEDALFLSWIKPLDEDYQDAARWEWASAQMNYFKAQRMNDLRGYAALQKGEWNSEKLKNYSQLLPDLQKSLRKNLIGICINQRKKPKACDREFEAAVKDQKVSTYYEAYFENAQRLWSRYFTVHSVRDDLEWRNSEPKTARIPFFEPQSPQMKAFVARIEDEWKWKDWSLKLQWVQDPTVSRVEFQPGVTPHVSDRDRNVIVLDSNESLDEESAQWTIKHEFGHVLGFVDCYQEFYDDELSAFVTFPLDETNLMCTRAGKMNETLYRELKRIYFE